MNKLLLIFGVLILMLGFVSAFYCIQEEDNLSVKQLKSNINLIAIRQDLESGVTPEAIKLKIKYFSNCK